jgi:hypothetical protein
VSLEDTPMMAPIIQWSCRVLKVNFIEMTLLVQAFLPVAFCLQETHLTMSIEVAHDDERGRLTEC